MTENEKFETEEDFEDFEKEATDAELEQWKAKKERKKAVRALVNDSSESPIIKKEGSQESNQTNRPESFFEDRIKSHKELDNQRSPANQPFPKLDKPEHPEYSEVKVDPETFKSGYRNPWYYKQGVKNDKNVFFKSVENIIKNEDFDDERLKLRFINWFTTKFRGKIDPDIFADPSTLKKECDNIMEKLSSLPEQSGRQFKPAYQPTALNMKGDVAANQPFEYFAQNPQPKPLKREDRNNIPFERNSNKRQFNKKRFEGRAKSTRDSTKQDDLESQEVGK